MCLLKIQTLTPFIYLTDSLTLLTTQSSLQIMMREYREHVIMTRFYVININVKSVLVSADIVCVSFQ